MNAAHHLETGDGSKIYYEDHGEGQPILLVHGWMCSSKFWQKNVPELANIFRVVTLDLRGHGNSSKALSGHTIGQYARDVRTIIEHLGLRDIVLAGWSLGGPVVLSYYEQYSKDSHLKALGLVDAAPFPFSPAAWNSHALRNYNYDGMNATFADYAADPRKFAIAFTTRMFHQKPLRYRNGLGGSRDDEDANVDCGGGILRFRDERLRQITPGNKRAGDCLCCQLGRLPQRNSHG